MFWQCPADRYAEVKTLYKPVLEAIQAKVKTFAPMAYTPYLHCGLVPDDPAILRAKGQVPDDDEPSVPLDSSSYRNYEWWEEERRRSFSDGSLSRPMHLDVARGGYGVFFGFNHPQNVSGPLLGPLQSSYRAELRGLVAAAEMTDKLGLNNMSKRQW